MDIQELPSATIPLSTPLYNPATKSQVTSIVLPSSLQRSLHFEAGYDTNGNFVANMYLPPPAQGSSDVEVASVVRFANGQITVYDATGSQLPIALPNGFSNLMFPLNLMGSPSGGSIAYQFATSNLQATASRQNGQLTVSGQNAQIVMQPASGSQVAWNYAQNQQSGTWVAQSVTVAPQVSNASMSRTLSFTNLVTNQNASANAARAKIATTRKAPPTPNTNNAPAFTNSFGPAFSCNQNASSVGSYGGTDNIDFQHGFTSNPCTWSRMVPWLDQDFIFGTQLVSKTDATSGLALQGQSLIQQVQATTANNFIFVGHSAGGLVARYAAQQLYAQGKKVHGVATLNTPHQGADAALTGPIALASGLIVGANGLANSLGCYTAYDNWGCYVAALIAAGAPSVSDWSVGSIHALNDFTPGSAFLGQLNGGTENFTQAAVIGETPQRWLVTRQMDEIVSGKVGATCNPEDPCGERNVAALTELFYEAVEIDFLLTTFEIFDCEFFDSCDPIYLQILEDEIDYDAQILIWMNVVDYIYRFATAPTFEGSDGLVQFSSQYYPSSSAAQYVIQGADSHGGATKSNYDHTALDSILANQFSVRTIASCSYAVSPQMLSSPSAGGSLSFSLTTQQGCPWAAVSNQPWVSVSSSSDGSSSGTISLAVQANPLIAGRSGTITVGNGAQITTVSVIQAGATPTCSYSLSPSGTLSLSNGGGSGTITVIASTGCTWAATSNAPWLTITSSGTGTGTGSFQYTAQPNNTTVGLTASVTVANQQVQFFEAPAQTGPIATGTVTISGSGYVTMSIGQASSCAGAFVPYPNGSNPPTGGACWDTGGGAFVLVKISTLQGSSGQVLSTTECPFSLGVNTGASTIASVIATCVNGSTSSTGVSAILTSTGLAVTQINPSPSSYIYSLGGGISPSMPNTLTYSTSGELVVNQ